MKVDIKTQILKKNRRLEKKCKFKFSKQSNCHYLKRSSSRYHNNILQITILCIFSIICKKVSKNNLHVVAFRIKFYRPFEFKNDKWRTEVHKILFKAALWPIWFTFCHVWPYIYFSFAANVLKVCDTKLASHFGDFNRQRLTGIHSNHSFTVYLGVFHWSRQEMVQYITVQNDCDENFF